MWQTWLPLCNPLKASVNSSSYTAVYECHHTTLPCLHYFFSLLYCGFPNDWISEVNSWDGQQRSWGGPGRNVTDTESSGRPEDFLWLGHILLIMLLPFPAGCIWMLINNLTWSAQKYVRFIMFSANWNISFKSCSWSEQKKLWEASAT